MKRYILKAMGREWDAQGRHYPMKFRVKANSFEEAWKRVIYSYKWSLYSKISEEEYEKDGEKWVKISAKKW
jgi:hypothetical protein